jgi:hypothetical protein
MILIFNADISGGLTHSRRTTLTKPLAQKARLSAKTRQGH